MKTNIRYFQTPEDGRVLMPAILWLVGIPLPILLILWMFGVF